MMVGMLVMVVVVMVVVAMVVNKMIEVVVCLTCMVGIPLK